ncbi:MAG: hypothetical protein ABFD18_09120 [Syntrophomonas sp.]
MKDIEFLDGFDKRMQILAAIDSIVNRSNRTMDIENLFERAHLDNIIFSVLVFIMERTLSEDEECTIDSVTAFLNGIIPDYGLNLPSASTRQVAEYIIKDILQNGGEARYYPVMKYGEGLTPTRIRLIDDKLRDSEQGYVVSYQLTNQGYDLLFRTKEVDQEISFTIEELKLRELIKRKNYKKAIGQSANLRQMIRQKRNDISQFIQKIRENIYDVDIREFEKLIGSTYALLEEEYGIMNEIRDMIVLSEQRLEEEENTRGSLDEEMKKARREIAVIRRNIVNTINEQKQVILERHNLSRIYKEMIEDSFSLSLARVYNFEQEILAPLEQCDEKTIASLWQLLNPLFKPSPDKNLNLLSLYERQARTRQQEAAGEGMSLEELAEDEEELKIKRLSEAHITIIQSILDLASAQRASFRFAELYGYLQSRPDVFAQVVEGEELFKSMLKLYDLNCIDIQAWQARHDEVIANATGELDVNYCLYRIEYEHPDLFGVKKIRIQKPDEQNFEDDLLYRQGDAVFSRHIVISDFLIEVDMV